MTISAFIIRNPQPACRQAGPQFTIHNSQRDASAKALPLDSPAALALRACLKNEHRGEKLAIPQVELYKTLEARGFAVNRRIGDETLRALCHAGYPVAATGAGIFRAITPDELSKARHYVVARFNDLRQTADDYARILDHWGRRDLPGETPTDGKGQGLLGL